MTEETRQKLLPSATGFAARQAIAGLRKLNVPGASLLTRAGISEADIDNRQARIADGSYREVVRPSAQRAVHFAHQRCGLLPCVRSAGQRLDLLADAILDVTQRGDIVLDPFCGSGTTILAAERTGRRGYAIELDPGHVDTAVARWERMTKQSAVHASGKTFAEMRAERRSEDGRT